MVGVGILHIATLLTLNNILIYYFLAKLPNITTILQHSFLLSAFFRASRLGWEMVQVMSNRECTIWLMRLLVQGLLLVDETSCIGFVVSFFDSSLKWHQCFGHSSFQSLRLILLSVYGIPRLDCESYKIDKHHCAS